MPRSASETRRINHTLGMAGLGRLDDPGLVKQFGFLMGQVIQTHEQFREFVNRCEPQHRSEMYNAVKPYIRFELKPLDVYVAELGAIAEAKQLPTIAEDGSLKPFKPWVPDELTAKTGDLKAAQEIINEAVARVHLELVCARCTKEAWFPGVTRPEALANARAAGWRHSSRWQGSEWVESELCPEHAG